MTVLSIAWQYLTGRAVATDPTDRQAVEWPPHPDRVFQALVAAWGAAGEPADGRAALVWLGQQAAPSVAGPECPQDERPDPVKVYVPVNDVENGRQTVYGDKLIALLPAQRKRAERYFPAIHVGDEPCALIWPEADPGAHLAALETLCRGVTNLGHSSSLVRMWIETTPAAPRWTPVTGDPRRRTCALRVPDAFRLEALITTFAAGGTEWRRPPLARWQAYALSGPPDQGHGAFDQRLILLRRTDGDRPSLLQTMAFTQALRGCLLAHVPEVGKSLVSGHADDGSPLEVPHLAYLPLPFVGVQRADGHLLGLSLALPTKITPEQEAALWQALDAATDADTGILRLTAGRAGAMELLLEDRPVPPIALRAATWTRPSAVWTTITPIALDRLPPRRHEDHDQWAAEQITTACHRQGLPDPLEIALPGTAVLTGVPPARAFPPLLRKDGTRRWHVHARLTFPATVAGPLVLGAGRYRGYGFCRPGEE